MTEVAKLIADMVRAGVDPDLIGRAAQALAEREPVRVVDDQAERKRAADRDRMRAKREAEKDRATSRDIADECGTVSPKKETSPTPPKEKTTPSQSEPNGSSKTPRQALECVLDAERAGAVIEHRKRIGKPMTVRAAELLAGKFSQCANPNDGADAMVANGWQGFEPGWMDRQRARGSPPHPPSKAPSQADVFAFIGRNSTSDPRSEYDDSGSPRQAIPHLREVGSQR